MLNSSSLLVLGGLLDNALGGVVDNSRPSGLGLAKYSDEITLTLCPNKPNCVSTTDDLNDDSHYIPPWTYNPDEGRGIRNPATQAQAMDELVDVVTNTDCDGFETTIVTRLDDYLYVEYKDPRFGFVDDVEFFFAPGDRSRVEYRTAGRVDKAPSAGETQRKRIKALRIALQKKGWKSRFLKSQATSSNVLGHFKSSRLISTRPYSCFATVLGTLLIGLPVTSNTLRLFRFTTDSNLFKRVSAQI